MGASITDKDEFVKEVDTVSVDVASEQSDTTEEASKIADPKPEVSAALAPEPVQPKPASEKEENALEIGSPKPKPETGGGTANTNVEDPTPKRLGISPEEVSVDWKGVFKKIFADLGTVFKALSARFAHGIKIGSNLDNPIQTFQRIKNWFEKPSGSRSAHTTPSNIESKAESAAPDASPEVSEPTSTSSAPSSIEPPASSAAQSVKSELSSTPSDSPTSLESPAGSVTGASRPTSAEHRPNPNPR